MEEGMQDFNKFREILSADTFKNIKLKAEIFNAGHMGAAIPAFRGH